MANENGVSIRPTEAVQMGLIDNFDGEITDALFRKFDYNGKGKAVLSLAIEIKPDDGEAFVQDYSAGEAALKNFVILTGNRKVKAVNPSITGLPDGSNAIKFLGSMVSGKFPEELMSDDVSCLIGTRAHFLRVANAAPAGVVRAADAKENTILLVSNVLSLPSENQNAGKKGAGKPTGKKTGAAAGAPAQVAQAAAPVAQNAAPVDNLNDKVQGIVLAILAGRGGSATKQEVAQSLFADYSSDADRNKMIGIVSKDDFLGANGQPWTYNGGSLTLG